MILFRVMTRPGWALFASLALLAITAMAHAQASLGCLVQPGDGSVFDLDSGAVTQLPATYQDSFRPYWTSTPSPDGHYLAFLEVDTDPHKLHLHVKSLTVAEPAAGVVIHTADVTNNQATPVKLTWSPDSRWFAFSYQDIEGKSKVGITNSSGQLVEMIPAEIVGDHARVSVVSSTYLVLYQQSDDFVDTSAESDNLKLTVLSVPALKPLWVKSFSENCRICGIWSPDGNQVAYILGKYNTDHMTPFPHGSPLFLFNLFILNLATKSQLSFALSGWNTKELDWSPDSKFIAAADQSNDTLRLLRLFDLQPQTVSTIDRGLEQEGGGEAPLAPMIVWAKDSSAIYYVGGYETKAYLIHENRDLTLALSEVPNHLLALDSPQHYALLHWKDNDQYATGIVDVSTGRGTALFHSGPNVPDVAWVGVRVLLTAHQDNDLYYDLFNSNGVKYQEIKYSNQQSDYHSNFGEGGGGPYIHQDVLSPDQQWLLIYTADTAVNYLTLMNVPTGAHRLLTSNHLDAMFSPDSAYVAVNNKGQSDLQLFSVNGSPSTTIPVAPKSISWSPDGSMIAVVSNGLQIYSRDGRVLKTFSSFPITLKGIYRSRGETDALVWQMCH